MLADAGGVNQAKQYAVYIDNFFNRISRGARNLTYNGTVFIQQSIQQGGFAGIGLAHNGHTYSVFYHIAQLKRMNELVG